MQHFNTHHKITAAWLSLLLAFGSMSLHAQDIHFSQYFAIPMLANPANTGAFTGTYRVGLNYRNQWQSVTVPWRTYDLYGDASLGKKSSRGVYFGAGLVVLRDKAGDGNLGVTKILASGALHVKFNNSPDHTLSAGMQIGYVHKSVDWNKLYFDSQWNDQSFDQSLPSNEKNYQPSLGYSDASVGLCYRNYSNTKYNYYFSSALMHVIQPHESFYDNGTNHLGFRPVLGTGMTYVVASKVALAPSINFMSQKRASETMAGLMLGYDLSEHATQRTVVYIGLYDRIKDAFFPVVGMDYGPWRGFISYDVNTSELRSASHGRGGVELSLQYTWGLPPFTRVIDIPCPRF